MKTTGEAALVCRVSSRFCALPVTHIRETMRPLPVEPMAGVLPPVSGVAIIRGAVVPVLDLGRLVSGVQAQPQRFVTLRLGERSVALAVEAVIGIRTIPREASQELPPLLREADGEAIARIGTLDAELLVVLQDTRLVPDAAWAALEQAPSGAPLESSQAVDPYQT
jgi:purine-binding chemotaxis protein CheW